MKNKSVFKTVNWLVPLFILGLIIFDSTLEALVLSVAYFVYRVIIDISKIYSYLAITGYEKGDMERARRYYEKAYRAKVKEPAIIASYIYTLILTDQFDTAHNVTADLEKMNPSGKAATSLELCKALLKWKKDHNLYAALKMAEAMDEGMRNQWYYNIYAKLCLFSNNMQKAKDAAVKGFEYLDTNPVALENLVMIHCINEDFDKAASAADRLIKGKKKMRPFTRDAYFYCATAYEMTNDLKLAAELYKKAATYPHTSMTYANNDIVLKKAGEHA